MSFGGYLDHFLFSGYFSHFDIFKVFWRFRDYFDHFRGFFVIF
jgi:hypothetical protein